MPPNLVEFVDPRGEMDPRQRREAEHVINAIGWPLWRDYVYRPDRPAGSVRVTVADERFWDQNKDARTRHTLKATAGKQGIWVRATWLAGRMDFYGNQIPTPAQIRNLFAHEAWHVAQGRHAKQQFFLSPEEAHQASVAAHLAYEGEPEFVGAIYAGPDTCAIRATIHRPQFEAFMRFGREHHLALPAWALELL